MPTKHFLVNGVVDYVKCTSCHLIFRQHPETARYDESYFDTRRFDQWATIQQHLVSARLNRIAAQFPPASTLNILEVGAGRGSLVPHLVKRGWQWSLFEPSSAARSYLQETFHTTVYATLEEVPQRHFDVLHLNHVLEHITDPVTALRAMRACLKPGGCIWIEVPLELMHYRLASLLLLFTRTNTLATRFFDPAHAVLYSRRTLRAVLHAAGFVHTQLYWEGWSSSTRYRAYRNTLSTPAALLALVCRYTYLDCLLGGGWLMAIAFRPTEPS